MEGMQWAVSVSEKIKKKYQKVVERNIDIIPYTASNGRFNDCKDDICWWTNGFYSGILWQLFGATKNQVFRERAEKIENQIEPVLSNYGGMDHDSGFRFLPTAVADYRATGNERSLQMGLLAADNLAGRYNPQGRYIRAWNDNGDGSNAGITIIDSIMNIPLLFWASGTVNDARFKNIAINHANTVMRDFVRDNGSVKHIVVYDPNSGEYLNEPGGQGYGKGSSWTRGQAWALYGFTLCYLYTGDSRYLETAEKISDYFILQIGRENLIPSDFNQPYGVDYKDDSASAIAASGFILLSDILKCVDVLPGGHINPNKACDIDRSDKIRQAAYSLLRKLDECEAIWSGDEDELLKRCTVAYYDKAHNFPVIYGDYFFLEAIFRLTGEESFIW